MKNINFDYHHLNHCKIQNSSKKTLCISLILTLFFAFLEFFWWIFSNSLALISDSFHMFSDVLALILSLVAIYFASKKPTEKFTYWFLRVEILAAFINWLALLLISVWIVYEAIKRIINPENIDFSTMITIAIIGLIVNIVLTLVLYNSLKQEENLNIKSALWHFLWDLLNSVWVIIWALIIKFSWLTIFDPIISIIISIIIFIWWLKIVKSSWLILLESVPENLSVSEIRKNILQIENIKEIHEFHLSSISEGHYNLSFHVILKKYDWINEYKIISEITDILKEKFWIEHVTIQIENPEINLH